MSFLKRSQQQHNTPLFLTRSGQLSHPSRVSCSDLFAHGKYTQEKRRKEGEFMGGTSYHINYSLTVVADPCFSEKSTSHPLYRIMSVSDMLYLFQRRRGGVSRREPGVLHRRLPRFPQEGVRNLRGGVWGEVRMKNAVFRIIQDGKLI